MGELVWRSRLVWLLVVLGVVLTGCSAWYESVHRTHAAGYSPLISVSFLLGIGCLELLKQFRDSAKSKGRLSGQTFLEEYTGLLTNAIEALQDAHAYNEAQLLQTQTKILKLIASVAVLFHPEAAGLGINANLMLYEPVTAHSAGEKFADHVFFGDPQRAASSYAGVLVVQAWAEAPQLAPFNFAIPVDTDPSRVLFGAPRTFVSGKEIVIANIHSKKEVNKMLSGQPDVVRDAILAFFARQKYKTFMSIAVQNSDKTIAVLNLQADQLSVFGSQASQSEMKKFIDPFCSILGIITAQTLLPRPAAGKP